MSDFSDKFRKLYGPKALFVSIFPDGTEVPWHPLTIGQYIDSVSKPDLQEDIEDNIFRQCVTEKYLTDHLDEFKAGTVNTVVNAISVHSIPNTPEELESVLNSYRYLVHENIFEQLVLLICRAFPSYSPRDIYSMDFQEFIHTVALAESKLLQTGILTEPVKILPSENKTMRPKGDTKKLRETWVAQQEARQGNVPPPIPRTPLPVEAPPIPEFDGNMTVISREDMTESNMALDGHERQDLDIISKQMLEQTAPVYKDYIEMMRRGEKMTPQKIKTLEQRKQEALGRMEANEKEYNKKQQEFMQGEKQQGDRLQQLFEKHLPKRKRRK
jgi:hypothetical protein